MTSLFVRQRSRDAVSRPLRTSRYLYSYFRILKSSCRFLDDPLCFFRCCRGNPRAVPLAAREAALLVCCPAAFPLPCFWWIPGAPSFLQSRVPANLLLSSVLLLADAGRSGSECFSALEPLVEYIEYRPLRYAARIENRLVFALSRPLSPKEPCTT